MSTPPRRSFSGGSLRVGDPVAAAGRMLIPVIAGQVHRHSPILAGTIRLQGLIVVEGDSWYAPLLPEGVTQEEFMAATPGLQEVVERIRTGA